MDIYLIQIVDRKAKTLHKPNNTKNENNNIIQNNKNNKLNKSNKNHNNQNNQNSQNNHNYNYKNNKTMILINQKQGLYLRTVRVLATYIEKKNTNNTIE